MEALLNDLREYWSVDEGRVDELAAIDSNDILAKTLGYLQSAVAESGAVITDDPLPVVRAEQYPLTLLFQNLIGNAIKYSRRGYNSAHPDIGSAGHHCLPVFCRR